MSLCDVHMRVTLEEMVQISVHDMSLKIANLTHWPLGDLNKILDKIIFKHILVIEGWTISG